MCSRFTHDPTRHQCSPPQGSLKHSVFSLHSLYWKGLQCSLDLNPRLPQFEVYVVLCVAQASFQRSLHGSTHLSTVQAYPIFQKTEKVTPPLHRISSLLCLSKPLHLSIGSSKTLPIFFIRPQLFTLLSNGALVAYSTFE